MNDYLSTIRLGQGMGAPGKQACWMTALSSHIGGNWTDNCECVDPTINQLCIFINDCYGTGEANDAERTADIMAFGLFEPLGTLGSEEDTKRRMYYLLDVSLRRWLPIGLRLVGADKDAIQMEACAPVVDHDSFMAAHANANAYANAITNPYTNAIAIANAYDYANANANAIAYAIAIVANAYANANAYAKKEFVRTHVFPVLRELIDLGPCAPKEQPREPVGGVAEFLKICGVSK